MRFLSRVSTRSLYLPSPIYAWYLVVLGLSKIFVLMMHSSRDSEPLLLPKLTWFHYEGSVDCDSHSLVNGEMVPATTSPKTATLSQSPPNVAKIVTHARYELTDHVVCKMRRLMKVGKDLSIRSLLWRTLYKKRRVQTHTLSCWKWW